MLARSDWTPATDHSPPQSTDPCVGFGVLGFVRVCGLLSWFPFPFVALRKRKTVEIRGDSLSCWVLGDTKDGKSLGMVFVVYYV